MDRKESEEETIAWMENFISYTSNVLDEDFQKLNDMFEKLHSFSEDQKNKNVSMFISATHLLLLHVREVYLLLSPIMSSYPNLLRYSGEKGIVDAVGKIENRINEVQNELAERKKGLDWVDNLIKHRPETESET